MSSKPSTVVFNRFWRFTSAVDVAPAKILCPLECKIVIDDPKAQNAKTTVPRSEL